eukprot:s2227_g14.t1
MNYFFNPIYGIEECPWLPGTIRTEWALELALYKVDMLPKDDLPDIGRAQPRLRLAGHKAFNDLIRLDRLGMQAEHFLKFGHHG